MDVEKREPSCTVGGNELVQSLWKTIWRILKKLRLELPCDPPIPFPGIYLKKTKILTWKDICVPMFIAALFTIAKIQEQHTHIHNGIWLTHKKVWIFAISNNVDGLWGHYAKWTKSCGERQIQCNLSLEKSKFTYIYE